MRETTANPENASIEEIRTAMDASPTKKGYIRLNAIFLLFEGISKKTIAKSSLVTVHTLNRWITLYNERGIDGLIYQSRSGRPPVITGEAAQQIKDLLENPHQAGYAHWTLRSLHGYLKEEIDLQCHYSTLVRKVHREGYVYRFPRSYPINQDQEQRAEYLKNLEKWQSEGWELWYIDETGIEGDPRPRRRWCRKGEKRTLPYAGTHIRESVIGSVCPGNGQMEALQVNYCNSDMFQIFLDQLAKTVDCHKVLLIMDNASWHKSKQLEWHGMKHEYLPPYSPDYNPIERIWLLLKARFFTDWIAKTPEELSDRITFALKQFFKSTSEVSSICKV